MPIHVLRPDVAAKIAAGEVVERPASAVKELIENALDASATRVTVEIVAGGLETIQVLDDGTGIAADEVELSFRRFATSKVADLPDLEAITTLGFRGEALASIAAVSSVTLVTKTHDEQAATEMTVAEGELRSTGHTGAPTGTSITVRGLFSSFPARRKFLSSPSTEASRVRALIQRYALAYPHVAFSLTSDGRRSVASSGSGSLVDAVAEIYDATLAGAMLPIQQLEDEPIRVTGLTGAPSVSRSTRAHINIFVNGRWIHPGRLGHAIEQAYHGFMGERRFPIAVLNIGIDPAELDVNVHPAKTEVRFLNERSVYGAVQRAIREALLQHMPVPTVERGFGSGGSAGPGAFVREVARTGAMWTSGLARNEAPSEQVSQLASLASTPANVLPALRVLGQSQTTYIVAEGPDGLYLVDQHAAHERVLYERVVAQSGAGASQALLVPEQLDVTELDPELGEALESAIGAGEQVLAESGFLLEAFGPSVYRLRAVPAAMGHTDPVGGLLQVVRAIAGQGKADRLEHAARSIACHGAVRAGKRMTRDEMEELTRLLEGCAQPHTCPHGRPTMIHLSEARLEREFGRA
jgi:DNA mismatch repair protein MutL